MCGIAGVYFFHDAPPLEHTLRRMCHALGHRGPDEEGFYFAPGVGLAHRRLKIIDLSPAASQPMTDEASRYHLIYNGEIYNFWALRKTLALSYPFFSSSDTEVILRLFQQHGQQCWKHLNGMFSLAIFDEATRELFLARDHAGIKPLYFYQDSEKLLFASEIKALRESGLLNFEIDLEALSFYLQLGYFPAPYTAYKNIRKLPQGHYARIHAAGVQIQPFWSIRSFLPQRKSSPSEQEHLDQLLTASVRNQMISDVPLGAFLSGGIDSSLIVALMHKISHGPVKTFTAGFAKMGYYDERPHAQKIATLFETEHHEFMIENRVEEIVPQLVNVFDEPFADSSAIPTLCLAQLARKHVTVALSGTGGDEMFGGYRKYMAGHWASMYNSLPQSVKTGIRKAVGLLPSSRKSLWQERALLLQRFSTLSNDLPPDFQLNKIFTPAEVQLLLPTTPTLPPFDPIDGTIVENMMLFDYESYLPENLLVKEDRCTMAFGLEARVPYLDREVVEFMTGLPLRHKVSRRSTKKLFKIVAAQYLPKWVVHRPKHGFGSPVAEWLRTDLKPLAVDALFGSSSFLKSSLIQQRFQEHQKGIADHSRQLWAIFMLELWHQSKS